MRKKNCKREEFPLAKNKNTFILQEELSRFTYTGEKVVIVFNNRKMFCCNLKCKNTTFAETFDFLSYKGKKSKRLKDEIINISANISSLAAAKILKNGIANVSKSIICNL